MDYATTVEEAVKRFYATGSKEVHTWILQVQASPEAWTFAWELLDPSKSWEVQSYAASTLHAKISRQWKEVPENEYPMLKARILASMKLPNTAKVVLSKLCQSVIYKNIEKRVQSRTLPNPSALFYVSLSYLHEELASVLANTNTTDAEEMENDLIDQVTEMLPYNCPQTLDLLLRVLTAMPGEFERRKGLHPTRFRKSLVRSWGKTTWLLQQIFQTYERSSPGSPEESIYLLSLECALAWLKLGQMPLDPTAQIYPHFLFAAAKSAPNREDEELDSRGWEVTQECLMMALTHGDLRYRPQLLWEWSKSLVSLAEQHGGSAFYATLTSLGEANSRVFLLALTEDTDESHRWTSETLIKLLLECSEHKGRYPIDETHSCIPFGFWYVLRDDISTLDPPLDTRARNVLKPIYARLAQALLRKSTLPSTPSEAGNAEERELFRCYRQDAADTLIYCYGILGDDLVMLLGQRLSQLETEPQKWTDVESTLHAFNALSLILSDQEGRNYEYIAALIDLMVSHVPYGHYPSEVLACACSAAGAYAEWIGENPDPSLERVLQLVSHGLSVNSVTFTSASMALKDIARECGPHLAPLAPAMLETIARTLQNIPPGSDESLRLMSAAGKLLSTLTTVEQQMCHLDATLGVCVGRLRELLEFNSRPINSANTEVASQLKMITTFISNLQGNIGNAVLDGLLPIFGIIIGHSEWSRDDETLEAMHTCAQKSLQALNNPESEARPLLSILRTSYKTHPHPAALKLLRQLIILFGKDLDNAVVTVFAEISAHTLSGVAACRSVGGDISDLSELLVVYLYLLSHLCKYNVRMLLTVPDQIPEMLRCGAACLAVHELDTVKSAAFFLNHAIVHVRDKQYPNMPTLMQTFGQEIVCIILQSVGAAFPRGSLEAQAEVLTALKRTYPGSIRQWLMIALADGTSVIATEAQKERFLQRLMMIRSKRSLDMANVLMEFSMECKGHGVAL